MSEHRRTLAVLYDDGAASAGEIGVGLADLGDIVFLVPPTAHAQRLRPVLENFGTVVPLTGSTGGDIALARSLSPDAVLTYSERMVRTTAELARALGLPSHTAQAAQAVTDKIRQRQVLRDAGVDKVRSHPLSSPSQWAQAYDAVGLPAIIKPVRGGGSRDTYAVTTAAEVAQLLPRLFPAGAQAEYTVEELLKGVASAPYGDYVSVESVCTPHGVRHLTVTGKFPLLKPFRELGSYWPSHLPDAVLEEVTDLTTRALEALDVRYGITHTELKLTADGPRIIEVNGRLSGHLNLMSRRVCGVDMVRLGGLLALGDTSAVPEFDYSNQVHFLFNTMAPLEPCRLEAVHGAADARKVEGITGLRPYVRPGTELPGGVMTTPLDVIWGSCVDHRAMVDALDEALSKLSYVFAYPNGTVRESTAAALTDVSEVPA
ncbi:acetyl-CoA carboxylase biotin carboxylase subunit family protein [Streptomyces sp. NPDC056949]|uniref:ATP-grasp domain-containing protein n=1 Tax=Streptomyces sp. NPDC056949 TaxID=3345976 RepID=UPI003641E947